MSETLYALLPAIYRVRDAREGEPLRALLSVLDAELDRVGDQITRTYDNWFIETCDDWVVPYLGDALGVRGVVPIDDAKGLLRAYVANTLSYRQRKGTASVLEDLARSVTGWPAVAVEMFQRLAATEHLDHIVPTRWRTPDLRDEDALERLDGPFETAHHFVDVRSIAQRRGRANIPNLALWVWRLESMQFEDSVAVADAAAGPSRYRFSPLAADQPLYAPSRDDSSKRRTREVDVPAPLRRRAVWAELEQARVSLAAGEKPRYQYFDPSEPALRVFEIDGAGAATEIEPDRIQICDLSAWESGLPVARSYVDPATGGNVDARVAVDPKLGRLAFLPGSSAPAGARVSYRHGFPGPLGGGTYERELAPVGTRIRYAIGAEQAFATMADAVAAWTSDGQPDALFELTDNRRHAASDIAVPAGRSVEIRSADETRAVLALAATWRITLADASSCVIDGLLVTGRGIELATTGSDVERRFVLRSATLVPGQRLATDGTPVAADSPSIAVASGAAGRLLISIERSITGVLDLAQAPASELTVMRSIIDAAGAAVPAIVGDIASIDASTIFGAVELQRLDASDCIFDDVLTVERTQQGCVRFSYVPPGSKAPKLYRCQPALALEGTPAADHDDIVQRVRPRFTSRRYSVATYAQLHEHCAREITRGASDESEMGAWWFLHQPQREANLATALDEYVRFGMEIGVFKAT